MKKEPRISISKRFEYWQLADELCYSLKCKDMIMHAETEREIQRILLNERKGCNEWQRQGKM